MPGTRSRHTALMYLDEEEDGLPFLRGRELRGRGADGGGRCVDVIHNVVQRGGQELGSGSEKTRSRGIVLSNL